MHKHNERHLSSALRHKHRHLLVLVMFAVLATVVAIQLLYPLNRALPFARLGGESVGLQSYERLAERVNGYFLEARGTLVAGNHRHDFSLGEAGASPLTDRTVARLSDYPLLWRIVPFSLLWMKPDVHTLDLSFESSRLNTFSEQAADKLTQPPIDAGLTIGDTGEVAVTPDVPGSIVRAAQVRWAMAEHRYRLTKSEIAVSHEQVIPQRSTAYFEAARSRAETLLSQPLSIRIEQDRVTPTKLEKARWLSVSEIDGTAILMINDTLLDEYIRALQSGHTVAPTPTRITRENGREVSRIEGEAGRTIDPTTIRQQLAEIINTGRGTEIVTSWVAVTPPAIINQRYTSSKEGLQAYLDDLSSRRNVRVTVQQIGGQGWRASTRGTESTVSASTYKLYVALMLFDKMDRGEISWDTPILDTSTRGCFERMIVASTNACAEEWIRQFGRSSINEFIYSKGFSSGTSFTNPIATHTTSDDLARYFQKLNDGSLMSPWARDYLLDALQRHPYRKGIPSGAGGKTHNKVGFLWDYSNDSAVVYHPRGTYVIAVMTKGLSFYAIADITREIEAIMYP